MSLCGGARCSGTWRGIDSINQYYRCIILKAVHLAQAAEWKDNYTSIEREKDEGRRSLNGFYLFFAFLSVGVKAFHCVILMICMKAVGFSLTNTITQRSVLMYMPHILRKKSLCVMNKFTCM